MMGRRSQAMALGFDHVCNPATQGACFLKTNSLKNSTIYLA